MAGGGAPKLQSRILLPFARIILLSGAAATFTVVVLALAAVILTIPETIGPKAPTPITPPTIDSGAVSDFLDDDDTLVVNQVTRDRRSLSIRDPLFVIYNPDEFDPIERIEVTPGQDAGYVRAQSSGLIDKETSFLVFYIYPTFDLITDLDENPSETRHYLFRISVRLSDGRIIERMLTIEFPALASASRSEARTAAPPTSAALAAQALALLVDPARTPLYFEAYDKALKRINRCEANTDTYATYLAQMVQMHKNRLKKTNALSFAGHICNLQLAAERQAKNEEERRRSEFLSEQMAASAARSQAFFALLVCGGALALFLIFAQMLVLFAMENHLRNIREARAD